MSQRVGPTRLILLNCGKFDYAEIDLDVPLHLVGPNNIGKTSLIALLQFLYVDDQNRMRFSRDMPTTRKYYFPDVSSFALFESLGPEGFMLTGVHGLGPVRSYEIERFVCREQYKRSDFLSDDNRILPWDQVKTHLATKGFSTLRPSDLRAALIGSTLKKGASSGEVMNLSLVPLKKRVGYRRFCTVFLNLLRLSHLRQEELKTLLLQLFEGNFTKRQINLQEDFAPQLDQLQRQKAVVQDLQRNAAAIRRILDNVTQRDRMRATLSSLYSLMGRLFHEYKADTQNRLKELDAQQDRLTQEAAALNERHEQLTAQYNDKREEKGQLNQIVQDLKVLKERFRDYHPTWTDTQILELEKKVRVLESTLESAKHESPEAIGRRLNTSQSQHKQLSDQLENIEHSLVSVLVEHVGAEQTGQLSRLFNEGILRLSTLGDTAKVKIHDVQALIERLSILLERFRGETYQDETVTLVLDAMAHFDPEDYLDPGRLREKLAYLGKFIQQTQETLKAAKDHETHIQALAEQKDRLEGLQDKRTRFRDYQAKQEEHRDLGKQVIAVDRMLVQMETQLTDIQEKQAQSYQKKLRLANESDELTWQLDKVDRQMAEVSRPGDTWPTDEPPQKAWALQDLIEHYSRLSDQHQQLSHRIDGELETIHSQTYDYYQGDSELETLTNFRTELESLEEKQAALEQNWISFTALLKKDFKELNRDMEKLSTQVHSLNGRLAKVHISNLANLKIALSFHPELQRHFRQVESNEAAPLFTDTAKTDEAMRKISQMLQERPVLSLEDLFDMHFEITTIQGGTKEYDHLDRIESNGTTITIKVLINLILLKGLLADDSANVPFYLDECSSLDSENLRSIVQEARKLGFIAVLASPEAMDAANHLYYLSEHKGRVTLNPKHSLVEIVRPESEDV
jgi:myosin heavy subunit